MKRFDVCNGDADGLCAVVQWRLHDPSPATLVTGLKREIALLERVDAGRGDEVLVCDLSMQRNRGALLRLLERGVSVRYFDHHFVHEIPSHPALEAHIDLSAGVCTSALVDRFLDGAFRAWAAVGAYGDNLRELGDRLAAAAGADEGAREELRRLGESINYNAYGECEADVRIAPQALFARLVCHADPLAFAGSDGIAAELDALREADHARARAVPAYRRSARGCIVVLPDAPWSRRVIGSFANELSRREPSRAHAVLRRTGGGAFSASVRAPLDEPQGAGALCARFGGSGRAAAGGIDVLAAADLDRFVDAFEALDWHGRAPAGESSRGGDSCAGA